MRILEHGSVRRWIAAILAVLVFTGTRCATAQALSGDPPIRIESWGAVSASASGPSATLLSSYSPPLLFDGDFTSNASQAVSAKTGGVAVGLTVGMNVFPFKHVGLQLLFDRTSYSVSGANSPYEVNLHYVSRPPPNNIPEPVDIHESIPWLDSSGSLTQMAIAFNVVVRMRRSDHVAIDVSGGPAVYRFTGDLQPIAYTGFHLGGHSVLFEDTFQLSGPFEPAYSLGFNGGVTVDVAIGRHAAITLGYRYFGGSDVDMTVNPTTILNPEEIGIQQPIADIASRLSLSPIRASIGTSRFIAGFKINR
jgi:hypothetical protein